MGTITYHKPVGVKAVDSIREHCFTGPEERKRIVAMTATREAVFVAYRVPDPDSEVYVPDADGNVVALLVFKLSLAPHDHYNFGYKDMDESMGPYRCEAPLSIIAKCSPLRDTIGPQPEYSSLRSATEYRARCRAVAASKAKKRSLKPGDVVTLPEPLTFAGSKQSRFTVERARVRGRKGMSTVFRADNGMPCLISAANLGGATFERRGQ
jgi:hypothetical protein